MGAGAISRAEISRRQDDGRHRDRNAVRGTRQWARCRRLKYLSARPTTVTMSLQVLPVVTAHALRRAEYRRARAPRRCARARVQAPDRGAGRARGRGGRRPDRSCRSPAQPDSGRPPGRAERRSAWRSSIERLQVGVFADTGIQRVKIFNANADDRLLRQARDHRRQRRGLEQRRGRSERQTRLPLRPRGRPYGQGRAVARGLRAAALQQRRDRRWASTRSICPTPRPRRRSPRTRGRCTC